MEVTVSFKTKAGYNKFMRNMRNGKGTVLSNKNVDLAMEGEGVKDFFNDVGKKIKKYGKQATKIALPSALGAIGSVGGVPGSIAGMTAGQMIADNAIGKGIGQDIKRAVRRGVQGIKGIARRKEVKRAMNSIRPALRELKKIGKEAMHQKIAETALNMASNLGENDPLKQQALSVIANEAHGKVAGLGFKKMPTLNMTRWGKFGSPEYYANLAKSKQQTQEQIGKGYSDSLGGDALLSNSVSNMTSTKRKKTSGGSFKLP